MKKLLLSVLVLSMFVSFGMSNASAKTIGVKVGYVTPKDDLKDYDNDILFGVYFNMGHFLINNLNFRPSVDKFNLEDDNSKTEVWGIHFDWYWNFLGTKTVSPFLGFGPVLNYYNHDDDNTADEDSDAGVDLFLGADLNLGLPVSLMVEGRYKILDIADRNQTAWCINLGVGYNF